MRGELRVLCIPLYNIPPGLVLTSGDPDYPGSFRTEGVRT